jgi:hypothetical protein
MQAHNHTMPMAIHLNISNVFSLYEQGSGLGRAKLKPIHRDRRMPFFLSLVQLQVLLLHDQTRCSRKRVMTF